MVAINFNRETIPTFVPNVVKLPSLPSLFESVPETVLKKGETIFNERNAHLNIYLVTKGIVKLHSFHDGKEMLEDYIIKGELFNCEALIGVDRQNVAAKAMNQLTAIKKIQIQSFRRYLQGNTALYAEILNSISASLERSQERLRRLTLLHSDQRVIHFLANHTKKAGRRVGYEYVIKPAMTHQEIGNIAGTSRQTATTVLNELRKKGIIHFNRSYLIVRDIEALMKLADLPSM